MKTLLLSVTLAAAVAAGAAAPAVRTIDVRISGGTYTPAKIEVKKGEKIRLSFTRDEKPTCGDEIVIAPLNIREKVTAEKPVVIDLTANENLTFSCGMEMMSGKIVVQ